MKIVSYNVNGLRQRIAQFGSLRNLLNSFDADIICFQVLPNSFTFSFSFIIHECFSFRKPNCGGRKSLRIWSWPTDTNRSFRAPAPPRKAEPAIPVTPLFHQQIMYQILLIICQQQSRFRSH